jgi:hypothetical protein
VLIGYDVRRKGVRMQFVPALSISLAEHYEELLQAELAESDIEELRECFRSVSAEKYRAWRDERAAQGLNQFLQGPEAWLCRSRTDPAGNHPWAVYLLLAALRGAKRAAIALRDADCSLDNPDLRDTLEPLARIWWKMHGDLSSDWPFDPPDPFDS